MAMLEEVKVGFIGCGGNARGHIRRIMEMPGAKLIAVCDVAKELADRAAQDTGATAYTQHKQMLDSERLDCVYLSIPVFAHGEPEMDVIQYGLPFFVEKPVAIDLSTARQIEDRVRQSGLITCVGYQLRYCGSTDLAREQLSGATIGTISGSYHCGSGRGEPTRWVRIMSKSGGQLVEQATHTIDLMRYLGGEIQEVFCYQANRMLPDINCPDQNVVTLRFQNGALGSLVATWTYDPSDWSLANLLEITFDDRVMRWTSNSIRIFAGGEPTEETRTGANIDEVFINAVARNDASAIRSPYPDAVKSLAVSLAANESAQTGRPVKIAS